LLTEFLTESGSLPEGDLEPSLEKVGSWKSEDRDDFDVDRE